MRYSRTSLLGLGAVQHPARILVLGSVGIALGVMALLTGSTAALPGDTVRVSVDSAGNQANDASEDAAISADGRYVAFSSDASNLVPGDDNGAEDVFVRDRQTGTTERVSVASDGTEGSGRSGGTGRPGLSADGRFVAFPSEASNLVPGDTNGATDIFVHDRQTETTERVGVLNGDGGPALSADGRFVAFGSWASDLVPGDTNGATDVFVHDWQTGTTERVSVASDGSESNDGSYRVSISADGRFVGFDSYASTLVDDDANGTWDAFVHDRQTGTTERVSVATDGSEGDGASYRPALSADGQFVAFYSRASNLVPGDNNGESDVFVRDRQAGTTERVSVASDGTEANSGSFSESISADGRFVVFESVASNLAPGGVIGTDVFVHDRQTGMTQLTSVASGGAAPNSVSSEPSVSADGHFVAFESLASNLADDDTNNEWDIFVHELDFSLTLPTPTPTPTPTAPPNPIDLVAVDMNTTANDDSTVGAIQSCGAISAIGGTLTFDLIVKGVDPRDRIGGYQVDIDYDPSVIQVSSFIDLDGAGSVAPNDVTMISRINSTGGAGFMHLSDAVTNPSSMSLIAADGTNDAYAHVEGVQGRPLMYEPGSTTNGIDDDFDGIVDNDSEASGDGVLARVTVTAVGAGVSPLTIPSTLGGADGFVDTLVVTGDGLHIPITTFQSGQVVVGGSCPDGDGDGFTDGDEGYIGTDPSNPCAATTGTDDEADDKWPSDFDDNQVINISDVFRVLPPVFGSSSGSTWYTPRADLAPDAVINISDVFGVLPPVFGSSCTP